MEHPFTRGMQKHIPVKKEQGSRFESQIVNHDKDT